MIAQAEAAAAKFGDMQRKISENAANGFGGAVVICGPDGTPVEWLMVGGDSDAALFWGTVQTQVGLKMEQLKQEAQRRESGWGGGMTGPGRGRL
jgi:hypothetical protein